MKVLFLLDIGGCGKKQFTGHWTFARELFKEKKILFII